MISVAGVLALVALSGPAFASNRCSPTVTIANGTVVGFTDNSSAVDKFLGVPYAEPPVGDLRLALPEPLRNSFGTLDANAFGPACYGRKDQGPQSEDCLTLNIWRPASTTDGDSLPVFVWLFGGGLTGGDSSDPRTDGTQMARISQELDIPIIVVSLNYRLGPFGFLNGQEMADLGLLNLGMLDQRLALHWVQENIAAFGGDPAKVTLGGESAGAVSTYSHMMAYGGRDDGLFRGAILESGGAFPLTLPNTTAFQATFDKLFTNTTCESVANASAEEKVACLRKLPVAEFRSKVGSSTGQSIDGDFSRTSIQFALGKGEYVKVPTLVGTNTDEGMNSAPTHVNTTEELAGYVADGFFRPALLPNETVSTLIDLYPDNPRLGCPYNTGDYKFTPGKLDKKACSIFGDIVQIGPARMIAQSITADGIPVYRYRFNHLVHNATDLSDGIRTGFEQHFVFSNQLPEYPWDMNLAYQMTAAWASFVHDLDPNPFNDIALPHWPEYGLEGNSIVLNGFGSWLETDTYREEGVKYIIEKVLPDSAL
ncbi:hypothetical protein jhhlp_004973 [Lomentospora prolificans]|uniref:Carboxylic ester hydrolase n=1 Tax=Lomentospora prolificans TaxID=41688 RepID=A0A2N3N871_9PEZI|nr:hypothetical protein jhhlp_004973 [Lomentospora prolificans]